MNNFAKRSLPTDFKTVAVLNRLQTSKFSYNKVYLPVCIGKLCQFLISVTSTLELTCQLLNKCTCHRKNWQITNFVCLYGSTKKNWQNNLSTCNDSYCGSCGGQKTKNSSQKIMGDSSYRLNFDLGKNLSPQLERAC